MQERWDHRADLAETAINERHAHRVWGLPRTNLCVVSWPARTRDSLFVRWHYWWQAHYLDCLIDAAERVPTRDRARRINDTLRGMRVRNILSLTHNRYYDDKAWLTLAMGRAQQIKRVNDHKALTALYDNLKSGIDDLVGVLPWRTGENFFNVPTNGPAAIAFARHTDADRAADMVDWIFDNLVAPNGLIHDGWRLTMNGPETAKPLYTYCQGVTLGACVDIIRAQQQAEQSPSAASVSDLGDDIDTTQKLRFHTRIQHLVESISCSMADADGVIGGDTGGGDGGLFKGILARYLAYVVTDFPGTDAASLEAKRTAKRLVLASAESVWRNRLEVNGLPVFSADWQREARLPQAVGMVGSSRGGAVAGSETAERDLSVQLSGWMLMEAAARVTRDSE